MKTNKKKSSGRLRFWPLELLAGIVIFAGACFCSVNSDMKLTETHLKDVATYIKNQCHSYSRLNLASESKSLMRIMQSVRGIDREIVYDGMQEENAWDTGILEQYVRENYVTGMIMLDAEGKLQGEYYTDDLGAKGLEEYLKVGTLLEAASSPEKTYSVRALCEDDSYVDMAACGRTGNDGIIVAYYHTPQEYVKSFFLSVQALLKGYSIENDGTIVVADGMEIVASNEESLVGKSTDDLLILQSIRQKGKGASLVQAAGTGKNMQHDFGLMEHGRDYYIYAYTSESNVFANTPKHLFYTLALYALVLIAVNMVRWKTAQSYREEQLRVQREYNSKLQNKNEQLKKAVGQADRANAAKTSFLSRMSHDIRTPLNGIIGLLKIDEAHPDDQKLIRTNREKIMIAANHLLALINDILQMSKLESGEIILAHEVMNLNDLSMEVLAIVEQRAAEEGITLEYDRESERAEYPWVYGSPLHVRQLFLNIYGNCIKYNKIGGKVTTNMKCDGVTDGVVTYRWVISDTGVGMSQEFLKHIFDPFAQERSDARSVYNGTGLGMAIVKGLVDEMNGTIEVTSKEGEGSAFEIVLPFEISKEKIANVNTCKHNETGIKGMHLLVAEDNELNAEIAEMLLGDEGAEVTIAHDGKEAVEMFTEKPQGTFDAILMDMMMPHVDGLAATGMIRAFDREDAAKIPIIAMTANAFDEDAKRCIEAGMDAHLSKPLQMDKVVAVIAKYCRKDK